MVTTTTTSQSRPAFHFTPRRGWINDPHGITWLNGAYHVFYQFVPDSTVWAPNCHWGHAVGHDLFTLVEHRPVLAPDDTDDGVWSGSAIVDRAGSGRIFYTSVSVPDFAVGVIREATTTDPGWEAWDKGRVIAEAPPGLDLAVFRDPFVFRSGDRWRMLVGAGFRDGTAAAIGYHSADLATWHYDGIAAERPVASHDPVWTGSAWECPQLFEVDGRHVLITSVWDQDLLHYAAYGIGSLIDGAFVAVSWGRLTYGESYYAPSFFRDRHGRPCLSLWMRGIADEDAGWASAHSIPHALAIQDGVLRAIPHADLEQLRGPRCGTGDPEIAPWADLVWQPGADPDTLRVHSRHIDMLGLETRPGELEVTTRAGVAAMPWSDGEIRIVLDTGIAEISTRDGMLGLPIPPTEGPLTIDAADGTLTAYELRPPRSRIDETDRPGGGFA